MTLFLLLACGVDPTTLESPAPPTRPEIATGGCGLDPYDWLAFDQVGNVVTWDPVPALSLSADTLRITLGLAGLPDDIVDIEHDVQTFRVRYTTQDRGELVESTMLVSMPVGAGDVPTLAWLHPTVGFADACAPSGQGLEEGAFNVLFASSGFYVVGPDYLGMNGFGEPSTQLHPYVIGEPTAVASLDALRAGWSVQDHFYLGSRGTRQTVLMGASEGGFTSLWADRYQPHYLPEANVAAVVAAVPASDLVGLHRAGLSEPLDATAGLAAAVTTWHDWYRMNTPLDALIEPSLAAILPDVLETECNPSGAIGHRDAVADFFTEALVDAVLQEDSTAFPDHACAMQQNTLLSSDIPYRSSAPVLYVVAENDELVVAAPTRDAFLPLCEAGYSMNYLECAGASHVEGATWSLQQQLQWIEARLQNEPLEDPCTLEPESTCTLEGRI